MVTNELRGERVDVVPFSDDPVELIQNALAPARVREVRLDEETGTATVIVSDFQLSLAIGKEGQNARLAARLTGWRIDIKSETQLAEEEAAATAARSGPRANGSRTRAARWCGSRPRVARPCRPRNGHTRRRTRATRPAAEATQADGATEAVAEAEPAAVAGDAPR